MLITHIKRIEKFFKNVHEENGTEARALIYKAFDSKGYKVVYPKQKNSVGLTISDIKFTIFENGKPYKLYMDCHSHHTMGAFWSATDDANEMIPNIIFGVFSWKSNENKWLFREWLEQEKRFKNKN